MSTAPRNDNEVVHVDEDDWAWRRRIRASPRQYRIYRMCVGVVGGLVLTAGIIAIPFPGPGWLIVFLGLGIWASEFAWAQSALEWVRSKVRAWERWLRRQNAVVQVLFAVATAAVVAVIFWVLLRVSGVPTWLPDGLETLVHKVPGLQR